MDKEVLQRTVQGMVGGEKGIWATDATEGTMNKRMSAVNISPTPELRRKFREMLISTEGLGEYIGGVILNDEIIRQKTSDGIPFAEYVSKRGMIPGIKVDKKTHDMANFPGEKVADGLDSLRDRLTEYKQMGARFTKFRVTIAIGEGLPTQTCIDSNSEVLARYAALVQEQDCVPIVEPEVLMAGTHDIETSEKVNSQVLATLFSYLKKHRVFLEGVVLKTAWVHPGLDVEPKPDSKVVAETTIRALKGNVPISIGGVVFLSGGDSPEDATDHLDNLAEVSDLPWRVGFSFERALEGAAMEVWGGKDENSQKAKDILLQRAKLNSLAKSGAYEKEMEKN
jgi:fructose-bisphosphate aldolase class I